MKIGLDFDNTIVCYDEIFYRVALEEALIPNTAPQSKIFIRDYLRALEREDEWTALQGRVYGSRMTEAKAFPGVKSFIASAVDGGHEVFIISHKTLHTIAGERHNLHQAARDWLADNEFEKMGLPNGNVYFELTREQKIARIKALSCDTFVDDLPEVLDELGASHEIRRILFDPNGIHSVGDKFERLSSWDQGTDFIFREKVR